MTSYPTPHIHSVPGDFAPTVLMPGDPLRARFIAEHYLEEPRLVNNLRNVQGYTGRYHGMPVSVMASGMGMPSIGIYSQELFTVYGVENIVRIGSAGAMQSHLKLMDLVIAQGCCTDSNWIHHYRLPGDFAPIASFDLLRIAAEEAKKASLSYYVGNLLSTDVFYNDEEGVAKNDTVLARWSKMGVLAVEMEAAALYAVAARNRRRALALCTISDHLITGEATTGEERSRVFTQMMELALNSALRF